MDVNPLLRQSAASQIIDALGVMTPEGAGQDQTDQAIMTALGPIADRLQDDVHIRAAFAAAMDLLFFLTNHGAQTSNTERDVYLERLRSLVPQIFPPPTEEPDE